MRRLVFAAAWLSAAIFAAGPAAAEAPRTSAVSDGGVAYLVRAGVDGHSLLLEVHDGQTQALLLPVLGTEGPEIEESPSLTVDGSSAYVVWAAWRWVHSYLYIASWSAQGGWSDVLELSGDPFSTKSNPQIAVTKDQYLTLEDGEPVEHQRALLHLVWWDEGGSGYRPLYRVLSVVDGSLQPLDQPMDLFGFTDGAFPTRFTEAHPAARNPHLFVSGAMVWIAFVDHDGGDAAVFQAQIPSGSLGFLADEARAQVVIFGREHPDAPRQALADHVLTFTYDLGRRILAEDVAAYVAGQVAKGLLEMPAEAGLTHLADEARAQVVIFGSRFRGGLKNLHQEARAQVVIFGQRDNGSERMAPVLASIGLHPLPLQLPTRKTVRTFLGPERLIFTWADGADQVRYIEVDATKPGSEGVLRTLTLSDGFDQEAAFDSLERRANQD